MLPYQEYTRWTTAYTTNARPGHTLPPIQLRSRVYSARVNAQPLPSPRFIASCDNDTTGQRHFTKPHSRIAKETQPPPLPVDRGVALTNECTCQPTGTLPPAS
ncbi:uncharacterized protein LY79DRAFT_334404 [Colletotrichum navitas]|uniref:Uncharacterized protein n=1 Tax=Colletotrichum navitas TaxID=681940 RepID=A0AAD8PSG2_9PEZI|nr:uncharacterized protein LY79DRAFT_334404 [Colletotrichum navitas]KAK1579761.1 hypothetical protein LY79DRAFT_334404 [Colletotrichum navitas]